jgi:hypothetical protein
MECVSPALASVFVNGSPTEEFHFGRGQRQGNPLPPFLFLNGNKGFGCNDVDNA